MEKKATPYKGPGIIVSRLGGWSPVRQTNKSAPEKRGVWAFIWPYFEPFLVGSTDHRGPTEHDRPSRMDLMKGNKRKDPSLALKRARYTGPLYTRMEVPGAELVGDWYLTDDQALKKYVFGKYPVEEWESWEQQRDREVSDYNSRMTKSYLEKAEKVAPFVKVGPRKPAKYNVSKKELEELGQSPLPRARDWNYAYRERMDEGDLPQPPEPRVKKFTPLRKYTGLMSKDHFEVFIPAHGGKLTSVGPRMASDIMTLSETHNITDIGTAGYSEIKEMKSATRKDNQGRTASGKVLDIKRTEEKSIEKVMKWSSLESGRDRAEYIADMVEGLLQKIATDFSIFGVKFGNKPLKIEFSRNALEAECRDLFDSDDFPTEDTVGPDGRCKVKVVVWAAPYADRIRTISKDDFYTNELSVDMKCYLQTQVFIESTSPYSDEEFEDDFEFEALATITLPVSFDDVERLEGRTAGLKKLASQLDTLEAEIRKIK